MKSKDVLKILKVTRPTLTKYVKSGKVKCILQPNGQYDYDEDSVLSAAKISTDRKCVIYARVSSQKQKADLENQIKRITEYANKNGYGVDRVYSDIASGLNYDRKSFNEMLNLIIERKIKTVIVENKDRLTRVSFDMWKDLFKNFNCELITVNGQISSESDEKEIFSDIISLIHCFATRMYSQRRKRKMMIIEDDLSNEIGL